MEIKNIYGAVIYTSEKETLREAVIEAVSKNANLENANLENAYLNNANLYNAYLKNANLENAKLYNANLENAYLKNANLENAYLYNANLYNAYLENANLENAYLKNANLENANLENAYLKNANLYNANLENANLYNANLPIFSKWSVVFVNENIKIGCKEFSIKEWDEFFKSDKEFETKRGSEDFARIEAHYLAFKAYKEHMDKFKEIADLKGVTLEQAKEMINRLNQ